MMITFDGKNSNGINYTDTARLFMEFWKYVKTQYQTSRD